MKTSLAMPQFGESVTQAVIVRWLKKEGETVKEGEPLLELETEKSVFAYESPFEGMLSKILQPENTEVKVGVMIAEFDVSAERGKKYGILGTVAGSEKVGAGLKTAPTRRKLSPLVRSLIKEHNLSDAELDQIKPSGPEGRLTKEDILNHLQAKQGEGLPASSKPGIKTIPLTAIRARIAEKMVLSKQKIPHAGCSIEVDMTEIVNWRRKENEAFKAREGFSISYLPFAIVAVTKIMAQHPLFNSSLKELEGKKWIEQYDYVNAGLAVATDMGLLLPVIKNAHQKNFLELTREVNRLSLKGKKGELSVEELTGGTFTFNNSGALGAIRSQQVIPPPQVAILAMNRIVRRPWVLKDKQETIAVRSIVDLDLAFDHRIIDGDHAVRFLVAIREQLENFSPPEQGPRRG